MKTPPSKHFTTFDTIKFPTKRRAAEPAEESTAIRKPSKLAKENNITAEEETEIKEAFEIFHEKWEGEKDKVIPIGDVKRAMKALGIPPTAHELGEFISILDPDSEGFATYPSFLAICALKFHARTQTSDTHTQEVDEAFNMFMSGTKGAGSEGKITLATLKRVARSLREEIDEDLMRRMILEANGGAGVSAGVGKDEFEGVMRRAGVWR
ncbi:related to calmodulin [Rhynchosporium secalis]|uniref:Calmodulin n=1 Tax=Rhynchosporium secalis TaxID=38038 RepID=A0A1E1MJZ3_RHYSE|nr:related to calmodulin [Rhynchosporium secalis]